MKQKTIERTSICALWTTLMSAIIQIASIIKGPFGATEVTYVAMAVMFLAIIIFFIMENLLEEKEDEMG